VAVLPLIGTSGVAIGVVMSMHTRATLARFGAEAMIPAGLGISVVTEIGPLVTGLLMAGRAGAGIGAELGAMKVTEQIDALEAVAVDSFRYLSVTRVVACAIALPLLTVVMDFAAILGGYLAETAVSGMPFQLYLTAPSPTSTFATSCPRRSRRPSSGSSSRSSGRTWASPPRRDRGRGARVHPRGGDLVDPHHPRDVLLVRMILFFFPRGMA